MIGQTLVERYEITSELGRGGMGAVYRAKDTLLEREVAIKVISAAGLGTEGRSRLLNEARAAAGLNHPNIVAVHDVGEAALGDDGEPTSFIVMELVAGKSLEGFRPQSSRQLVDIGQQMCAALEVAHEKGIIHRDLKPENVLLAPELKVKLSDFGLARVSGATRLTREGALVGTVSYLAPEVIQGQPSSVRSDLYALGVMLYELATGRPPFQGETPMAVLSQHLYAPVVPPGSFNEQLPAEIEALIIQLLAKDPEKRPESAADVRDVLESWAEGVSQIVAAAGRHHSQVQRLVRGRLVGRDSELQTALEAWGLAMSGQGRVLLVSGEPGIGKTRFARELTTFAEVDGATVLSGECFSGDSSPYLPIAQIIREAFDNGQSPVLPAAVLADLSALAPELVSYLPPEFSAATDIARQRLLDSVLTLCRSLADRAPLMLLVEDVHWADSGTVNVLRYLARRLRQRPFMLALTYRGTDLDEALPFQELLADLSRDLVGGRIKLTRLGRDETRHMLATLFDEAITPEFLEAIYRETEGNPFFIEEVSRALIDSGEMFHKNGRWHRPEMSKLAIPQGVRVTIQSRLSRLSDGVQQVLQAAALLGRDFRYDRLVAASGEAEDELIAALEGAEEAQIVEEVNQPGHSSALTHGPTFSFTHALIQSTLIGNLSTLRRQRLQRRMALALEETFPDEREQMAPLLARFFGEAGDVEKARHYLLKAGEQARQLYAFEEAARAFEGALVLLREEGDQEIVARTLMKLGLIYQNTFDFHRSKKAYDEGLGLWRQLSFGRAAQLSPSKRPLKIALPRIPATLDPGKARDTLSALVIDQVFSGLVELNQADELVPAGAVSWDVLEAGRRYIFHLRRDAHWSDGKPVKASDYEFAWKRVLSPEFAGGTPSLLFDICKAQEHREGRLSDPHSLGVKAVDEWTLQIDLDRPVGYFLQLMAHISTFPVPRHQVEALGDSWSEPGALVGNGAFIITSWEPGQGFILKRNPAYSGPASGNVQKVNVSIVQESQLTGLYEENGCDLLMQGFLEPEEQARLLHRYPEDHHPRPGNGLIWMTLNVTRPPTDNLQVRRVLSLGLDRERLARDLARITLEPATGGIVPPGIPGHVGKVLVPFEPGKARALLQEAGFGRSGQPLAIRCLCIDDRLNQQVVKLMSSQLAENLDIHIEPDAVPFNVWIDIDYRSDYQIVLGGWVAGYPDPDNYLRSSSISLRTGWRDQSYNKLVDQARVVANESERMAMYRQAEEILAQQAVCIPLFYFRQDHFIKPWFKNPPTSAMAPLLYKDVILEYGE